MKKEREILLSKEQIDNKVDELGRFLTEEYKDKNLLVVGLLKGSFIFVADLIRHIDLDMVIEFMTTSSYRSDSTETSGTVRIVNDIERDLTDYDVLIVDDIIDSGHTMKRVYEHLLAKNPKSLKTCTLLDKPSRRQVTFDCDYVGFTIEDKFIVGYGLNYGDYYRNINHIFVFVEDDEK